MRKILVISLGFLSLIACKPQEVLVERSKLVKLQDYSTGSFLSPSFKEQLDSNFNGTFLIRYSKQSESLAVSEETQGENQYVLELENSFVRHHFSVIDRPYFESNYTKTKQAAATYIVEVVKVIPTKHYTGIELKYNYEHFLTGVIITVKIIDAKSGEIVALLEAEQTPCKSGCKIKYNQVSIISITKLSKKKERTSSEAQFENEQIKSLSDQIVYQILLEIQKKTAIPQVD